MLCKVYSVKCSFNAAEAVTSGRGSFEVYSRLPAARAKTRIDAPPRDTPYQHSGILNYVFGHVWQRPGLGRRDRRFVTLASVGMCQAPTPIASHVSSALGSARVEPLTSRDHRARVHDKRDRYQ